MLERKYMALPEEGRGKEKVMWEGEGEWEGEGGEKAWSWFSLANCYYYSLLHLFTALYLSCVFAKLDALGLGLRWVLLIRTMASTVVVYLSCMIVWTVRY
jgi:hypothetical protein